jgi:hypothetical protein
MAVEILLALVWTHWFADFILQTDRIAINKSSNNQILLWHVTLYGACFLWAGVVFAVVNAVLHFVTDWCSSRITKKLWLADQRHWFFVVIGLDQAIHLTCLFCTYGSLQ